MTTLTIVCAWCGKNLGEKDGQGKEGESHAICDDCLNRCFPHCADLIRGHLEIESIEELFR